MGQRRFAIVAYAYNYPDALAATPVSAFDGMPVFLTRTAYISTETLDAMSDIGVTDVIIVGGTSVVSNAVFDGCAAQLGGTNHVLRLAGANRYETSKEIALWSCDLKGQARAVRPNRHGLVLGRRRESVHREFRPRFRRELP